MIGIPYRSTKITSLYDSQPIKPFSSQEFNARVEQIRAKSALKDEEKRVKEQEQAEQMVYNEIEQ